MKTMTTFEFLTWAFVHELGKVGAGGSGGVASSYNAFAAMAELGTLIDRTPNAYGVIPGTIDEGDAHPDALAAGEAVKALARLEFDLPADFSPFPDWPDEHDLIATEVKRVTDEYRLRRQDRRAREIVTLMTSLIVRHRQPDWQADKPGVRMVLKNGNPAWFVVRERKTDLGHAYTIECDGFDQRKRRPFPGAYRKWELSESIRPAILARIDWLIWAWALENINEALTGRLKDHRLAPFSRVSPPWENPALITNGTQAFDNNGQSSVAR